MHSFNTTDEYYRTNGAMGLMRLIGLIRTDRGWELEQGCHHTSTSKTSFLQHIMGRDPTFDNLVRLKRGTSPAAKVHHERKRRKTA
ncbi:MAG TPA: hypothetical protein DIW30_08195 [Bacteroidales bacterium]|nr:hypothetical protein [Bacteroidales bacterium]